MKCVYHFVFFQKNYPKTKPEYLLGQALDKCWEGQFYFAYEMRIYFLEFSICRKILRIGVSVKKLNLSVEVSTL